MNERMNKLKALNADSYENTDLDSLVVYTAVVLEQLGVELSLENIIVGAFKLFPKRFSLLGYPEFPDATRVEKSLWRCKGNEKKWIDGKTRHGYLLNDRSGIIAKQTKDQLAGPVLKKTRNVSKMRRKDSLLKEITDSPAYCKYVNGEGESISQSDICYLLQGTLDSSRETLWENLISLKRLAEELQQGDILEFLNWLGQRFKDFLGSRRM